MVYCLTITLHGLRLGQTSPRFRIFLIYLLWLLSLHALASLSICHDVGSGLAFVLILGEDCFCLLWGRFLDSGRMVYVA